MAKVTGIIKLEGMIDDMIFYKDQGRKKLVKKKQQKFVTPEMFHNSPNFKKVRDHGKEFGQAGKKAAIFRRLVYDFNENAKDYSYPGRVTKLLLEIIKEDTVQEAGARILAQGMREEGVADYLIGFEGNKFRPLNQVLLTPWQWDETTGQITIKGFNPLPHIDWPEKATHVQLCAGRSRWDFEGRAFETHYSDLFTFEKESAAHDLQLKVAEPQNTGWELLYFYIGFSIRERKQLKPMKRIHNTLSLMKVFEYKAI